MIFNANSKYRSPSIYHFSANICLFRPNLKSGLQSTAINNGLFYGLLCYIICFTLHLTIHTPTKEVELDLSATVSFYCTTNLQSPNANCNSNQCERLRSIICLSGGWGRGNLTHSHHDSHSCTLIVLFICIQTFNSKPRLFAGHQV